MSLKHTIEKIRFSGPQNVYVAGLCLRDGKIVGYKIYNKIYSKSEKYHDFLKSFGGENCLNLYQISSEWQNMYPGFSGFTCGVEVSDRSRLLFGFKDVENNKTVFNSYLVNPFNQESELSDTYSYLLRANYDLANDYKLETEFVEVNNSKANSFCFCPKIDFSNLISLEYDIKSSLDEQNIPIFQAIKENQNEFFIVNFGVNPDYQKIYIVGADNRNLDLILELIKDLTDKFGSATLLS